MPAPLEPFDLVVSPIGYFRKREITNLDARALVVGSKNMLISDADKVVTRLGFSRDGQVKTVNKGIYSDTEWQSKVGLRVLRAFDGATANTGKLQLRHYTYNDTDSILYRDILTTLANASSMAYSTWWNATENKDILLIVDGTTTLRSWGGGVAFVAAQAGGGTTLTLVGTTSTWKQLGFYSATGSRAITINGTSYTYTGGESTQTLTGVAALPAITLGDFVIQTPVSHTSITGLPATYTFNTIDVQNNHVWLGTNQSRDVYVSKSTDFVDYTYTSPVRLPTDGFKMTFDNYTVAFVQDDDVMYVISGLSDQYKIERQFTADGTGELFKVRKMRAGAGQAALSQRAVVQVKNGIIIITNEKTIDWFTSVENINTPQSLPISDPIKDDLLSYDLTNVSGIYFQNELWVAVPSENLILRYDFDKALWQPPQTIPVAGFFIVDNELYAHSNSSNVSFKLNDGLTDDGVAIEFAAAFAYRQFGTRSKLKQFDEYYSELYMSAATTVNVLHNYEYGGSETTSTKSISGADEGIMFAPVYDSSLGKNPLGSNPLGSTSEEVEDLNKYRCIHEMKAVDFFEHQVIYSCDGEGMQFEILAHGPAVRLSTNVQRSIKR